MKRCWALARHAFGCVCEGLTYTSESVSREVWVWATPSCGLESQSEAWATPLEKTDSPYPSSQQLPIAPQLGLRSYVLLQHSIVLKSQVSSLRRSPYLLMELQLTIPSFSPVCLRLQHHLSIWWSCSRKPLSTHTPFVCSMPVTNKG